MKVGLWGDGYLGGDDAGVTGWRVLGSLALGDQGTEVVVERGHKAASFVGWGELDYGADQGRMQRHMQAERGSVAVVGDCFCVALG